MAKQLEAKLQIACIKWFALQYPEKADLLFHIPNGGKRNIREAVKFKKMGVKAGIPDLFLSQASGKYFGLYIEMKAGKGKLTDNQKNYFERFDLEHYACREVKSIEEFISVMEWYLNL